MESDKITAPRACRPTVPRARTEPLSPALGSDQMPSATPSDVIGVRGPIAPPEMCNGLMAPIVVFDQIYSFERDALIKAIPQPEKATAAQFGPAAEELFNRNIQLTDNAGATNEHRALNYLPMRYPAIYAKADEEFGQDRSLTGVEVRLSPLSSVRKVVDVIFSYTGAVAAPQKGRHEGVSQP